MELSWTLAFGLVVTAVLVALAALLAISALSLRQVRQPVSVFAGRTPATVLLFDGEVLVDATPEARALIDTGVESGGPWFRALWRLESLFPGLSLRLEGLQREGRFVLCSGEDVSPPLVLRVEQVGGLTRLTLVEDDEEDGTRLPRDAAAEVAVQQELAGLRDALCRAPLPIWRENAEGQVTWANGPYIAAAVEALEPGTELSWPLPQLFTPESPRPAADRLPEGKGGSVRRALHRGGATAWFEVVQLPAGREAMCYALPANRLVQAETSLRDFMQTLTKTFAQLPIGLAIFDRARVLQLFNPALIDLTGLAPEFLIARPTLASLLDALRESAMIPEPKDYRSWRRQITGMEEAAASGLFEETWALPSGQTYRVTGRPHPNGALAFLLEDISSETMRTRRYHADLELGQAVIDAMTDAVVVFGQDGEVAMSNAAAARLWGADFANPPANGGEPGAIALWRQMTAPTLLWNDLADYIGTLGPRDPWEGEIRTADGRLFGCRVSALPHGSTLVSFRQAISRVDAAGEAPAAQAVMIA